MSKPTQEQIDGWVNSANSKPSAHWKKVGERAAKSHARYMLRLHGLGLDGKPDATIARDAAATGARLPRGTVRVS